jgi:hypothetical protein
MCRMRRVVGWLERINAKTALAGEGVRADRYWEDTKRAIVSSIRVDKVCVCVL